VRATVGDVLVCAGAALAVISSLGVLVMRSAYDRLHYTGPLVLSALLIAAAVLVRHGWSLIADKALLTAAFVLVSGPVVTHAAGRAFRAAERGDWRAGIGSEFEIEESER
jgi:multisubunit Na+/H+ antiporter MnhG subunit